MLLNLKCYWVVLLVFGGGFGCDQSSPNDDDITAVIDIDMVSMTGLKNNSTDWEKILTDFDMLYSQQYTFLANLYDPVTGGFYESLHEKGSPRIESTARGIRMLEEGDIIDDLPENIRQQFIGFFQRHQDSATGFFEDPQEQRGGYERRGRALGYSTGALRKLGAEPLYPLPVENESQEGTEHLQSKEAFKTWLDSLPWENAWKAGSIISAQGTLISNLPGTLKENIINFLFNYLENHQETETGLWGGGVPYVRISGAFKLSMLYDAFDRPMPHVSHIYESLLECMREEMCLDATWVRNPLHLLLVLQPRLKNFPDEERQEIIRIAMHNIKQFLRADGSFARRLDQHYGVTDGCSQAMKTRDAIYKLAGLEPTVFPYAQQFFITLEERNIIAK